MQAAPVDSQQRGDSGPASNVDIGSSGLIAISETRSRQWGELACLLQNLVLAMSATVSVAMVNKGGDGFHPIGRTKGKPISCSPPSSVGNMMTSLGTSSEQMAMR
jgi:hypothetical protein